MKRITSAYTGFIFCFIHGNCYVEQIFGTGARKLINRIYLPISIIDNSII